MVFVLVWVVDGLPVATDDTGCRLRQAYSVLHVLLVRLKSILVTEMSEWSKRPRAWVEL